MKRRDWSQYLGAKFGKLEVIGAGKELVDDKGKRQFYCKCDCGNEKLVDAWNVLRGRSKTCGCGERLSRYSRKHAKDIRGKRFGCLTVVGDSGRRATNGSVIWNCLCDCGNNFECSSSKLKRGEATSCGCKKIHGNTINLVGHTFGELTVMGIDRDGYGDRLRWLCKCSCGTITSVTTNSLTSGKTASCGCKKVSSNERYISDLLEGLGIAFEKQKRFEDCRNIKPLPFDFYLPALNTAIEYDGKQHYTVIDYFGGEGSFLSRQRCDKIKDIYCSEKNIRLIRLPYTMSRKEISEKISALGTRNE